ncbi:hypothetical protein HPP92_009598, partial [Vanilla planifolia]
MELRGKLLDLISISSVFVLCSLVQSTSVSHDGRALLINGQRRLLFSGSIHYPRSTPD